MPRAGLSTTEVIRAGAELADEVGYPNLAMAPLAQKLGVRTPSLYKHVASLAELQRGIAVLAMTELDRATRDAMHGFSGTAALDAFARSFRDYAITHPGRYASTVGAGYHGEGDPMLEPAARMVDSITVVLRGYGIPDAEMDHAMRTIRSMIHGFAELQLSGGFQWSGDPEVSFEWMLRFIDAGLRHHTR
ncbi:TetR/AcrR family transcriptional regulator [Nocardia uniformis]|uniref:TetR/AcrR family transcriptional regulator n=1 Tax=Nocardia uniformis TaxID=53432 RepID=A0A849CHR0_9NOCA|nr:TetR/AcrR family transcriptional regulator [Nocardia uniformis]NNH75549.1 TetR/AcrR family transcriptional regulator [Nocardia uniformis]